MTISKTTNYFMSRKSWPVLYSVLLCIDGQTFMGIQWGWTRYGRISWMASRLFRILHWKTYIRRKQTKYLILRVVLAFHSTPYFWFWFFLNRISGLDCEPYIRSIPTTNPVQSSQPGSSTSELYFKKNLAVSGANGDKWYAGSSHLDPCDETTHVQSDPVLLQPFIRFI